MDILQIIISTVISTGILAVFINHWYDKKLKTHEIKLEKYLYLIEQLAKLAGNETLDDNFRKYLNEALLFTSDNVVKEILKFNKVFTEKRKVGNGNTFRMEAKDMELLIIAIRKDLDLKSKSIIKEGLRFFQKQQS